MYFDYSNYHTRGNDQYGCRTHNCDREQASIFAGVLGEMRYLVYMKYLLVRQLQGIVTYQAKFLPRLSTVVEPIRRLTKQDVEFKWADEQDKAKDRIKKLVTTTPILAHYDPKKELLIQCDASSSGLAAVLLQDGKPFGYASRALSTTEYEHAQATSYWR